MGLLSNGSDFREQKNRLKKKKTPIDFSGRVTLASYRRPYLKLPNIAFV